MSRRLYCVAIAALFLIGVHARARAQVPPDIEAGLQTIGHVIAPPATWKLYTPLFAGKNLVAAGVKVTRDAAYGPDPLQKLDIFQPEGSGHTVVVFIHGGNFQRGDKVVPNTPFFDNVSGFLAAQSMVGVTANYRLAPPCHLSRRASGHRGNGGLAKSACGGLRRGWREDRPVGRVGRRRTDCRAAVHRRSALALLHSAPAIAYCASVSPNLRCVSSIVRQTAASVSDNVRRKWPSIAHRTVRYCASLHIMVS